MSKADDTLKTNKNFNEILRAVATHNPKPKKEPQNKPNPPKEDKDK